MVPVKLGAHGLFILARLFVPLQKLDRVELKRIES